MFIPTLGPGSLVYFGIEEGPKDIPTIPLTPPIQLPQGSVVFDKILWQQASLRQLVNRTAS